MKCKCNNIIPQGRVNLGYTICQLADTRFGQVDEEGFSYITNWFNYKGFTYIIEQ